MAQTVAIDPRYGQRKTREFVVGDVAGQLFLSSKVCRYLNPLPPAQLHLHTPESQHAEGKMQNVVCT